MAPDYHEIMTQAAPDLSTVQDDIAWMRDALNDLPGLTFFDEMPYGRHMRWLTVMLVDPKAFGADREQIRLKLEEHNIESHPLWKPLHLQPVFRDYEVIGGDVAEALFNFGLCLPSGTAMTEEQLDRVVSVIREMHRP
jgi:dTDP-4-amino-4,6-dideoxygalactose transaminase